MTIADKRYRVEIRLVETRRGLPTLRQGFLYGTDDREEANWAYLTANAIAQANWDDAVYEPPEETSGD